MMQKLSDIVFENNYTIADVLLLAVRGDVSLVAKVFAADGEDDEVKLNLYFDFTVSGKEARKFLRDKGYDLKLPQTQHKERAK